MKSEVEKNTDFSYIRYAQCWEDAEILDDALNISPGKTCVSISSAGDNSLAMLTKNPEKVIAIDISYPQLACLELRIAAYKCLTHCELLSLMGEEEHKNRDELYKKCRNAMPKKAQQYWDSYPDYIKNGIGHIGKFEKYLGYFGRFVVPLCHSKKNVDKLFAKKTQEERLDFYTNTWGNWRWKILTKLFTSSFFMGRAGRDPNFFKYAKKGPFDHLFPGIKHVFVNQDPTINHYMHWLFYGVYDNCYPIALREEHFDTIRNNIDKIEVRQQSIEELVSSCDKNSLDCFNFSDLFEYISLENYHKILERVVDVSKSGARLAYWNMVVPRERPEFMADKIISLPELSEQLHKKDKIFFYSRFVVEEVR